MFNYSGLIKKAWKTAWKNKILWLFGLFIAAGIESVSYRNYFDFDALQSQTLAFPEMPGGASLIVTIIAVIIALVLFIISVICQGSIIKGIHNTILKTENKFKPLWTYGVSRFWRVLGIEVLVGVAIIALVLPVLLLAVYVGEVLMMIFLVWLILILLAVVIFGSFFYYILIYAVLEDKSVGTAIQLAWKLYVNNIKVSILVSLINIGFSIAFAVGLMVAMIILMLPFVLIGILFSMWLGAIGALITAILGAVVVFIFMLFYRGLLNTFLYSIGVLTYLELRGKKVLS